MNSSQSVGDKEIEKYVFSDMKDVCVFVGMEAQKKAIEQWYGFFLLLYSQTSRDRNFTKLKIFFQWFSFKLFKIHLNGFQLFVPWS